MSTLNRASKNVFYKAVAELLSRFIYLFFFIYMARKLGTSDFGLFSFAFSFAGIFVILIDPGLNILLTRDVAKNRSHTAKYSGNFLAAKMILSVITFILIWAIISLLGYDSYTILVVLLMGIALMLHCFLDFFISIANGHERMEIDAVIRVSNKFIIATLGIAVLAAGSRLVGLLSGMVLGSVLSVVLGYYLIKKIITKTKIEFDWSFLKSILLNALPIALTMIFTIIYFKIDVVMLSLFKVSNSEIGLYSAAVKLIEVLNVIPAIFVGGLFPILAALLEESKSKLEVIFKKTHQILLLVAIPIVVITSIFSKEIITIIYGNSYAGATVALKIVIWASLFIFINVLFSNMIIVANKQILNAAFAFICLALNIVINIILIPRYGIVGAGIATVATNMVLSILNSVFIVRYFENIGHLKDSVKAAVCGVLLAFVLFGLDGLNLVFFIPLSALAYLALIALTRTFSYEDMLYLKQALLRTKT